jgi:hypothetical protein
MFENSARLGYSENAIAQLLRDLADLRRRVAAVEQMPWGAQGGGDGGGSSTEGFFVCMPSAPVAGASWTGSAPTGGVPFSPSPTVYQVSSTGITSLGTQTVNNWLPASLVSGKACVIVPDGAGAYGVVSQSCT